MRLRLLREGIVPVTFAGCRSVGDTLAFFRVRFLKMKTNTRWDVVGAIIFPLTFSGHRLNHREFYCSVARISIQSFVLYLLVVGSLSNRMTRAQPLSIE
jgi:hypothetical protein